MKINFRDNHIVKDVDIMIVDISGNIKTNEDYDSFKKAIDEVLDRGCVNVLLNFKNVNFINSSGLGRLILASKRIIEDNGSLKITELSDDLRELFTFTRLDSKIPVFATENEAVESF